MVSLQSHNNNIWQLKKNVFGIDFIRASKIWKGKELKINPTQEALRFSSRQMSYFGMLCGRSSQWKEGVNHVVVVRKNFEPFDSRAVKHKNLSWNTSSLAENISHVKILGTQTDSTSTNWIMTLRQKTSCMSTLKHRSHSLFIQKYFWSFDLNLLGKLVLTESIIYITRYPGGSMKSSRTVHNICVFLFHLLPALFVDALLYLTGNKPMYVQNIHVLFTISPI